jgi:WD40 repeat protein
MACQTIPVSITGSNFSTVIHPTLPIVASAINQGMQIQIMYLSDNRTEVIRSEVLKQATMAPNMAFHQTEPRLATSSGQLHNTLEYHSGCGYLSPKVTIYQLSTDGTCESHPIATLVGHSSPVTAISFCPDDSSQIATGDNEGEIRIWKIHCSVGSEGSEGSVSSVGSEGSEGSKGSVGSMGCVRFWKFNGSEASVSFVSSVGSVGSVKCVSVFKSPFSTQSSVSIFLISSIYWMNQNTLVASHWNGVVQRIQYNKADEKFEVQSFRTATPILTCTRGHPSGDFFVTGGSGPKDGTIQVWSNTSFENICTLDSISSDIISMEYDTTRGLLILGCVKEVVIVSISPAGDAMHVLSRNALHRRYVTTVAVHTVDTADGVETRILSGTNGGSLVLSRI